MRGLGINQTELSKELNIQQSNLSEILSGKRSVSNKLLESLSSHFDINLAWLLTGEGEMNKQKTASLLHIGNNNRINNKATPISGSNVNYNEGVGMTNEPQIQYKRKKESENTLKESIRLKEENEALRMEGESLKEKIKNIEMLLEEKERLIQVLMKINK